jgi:hypothetical protein
MPSDHNTRSLMGTNGLHLSFGENVLGQQGYYIAADEDTIVDFIFLLDICLLKN